jgi:hypothetical protein
MDVLLEVPWYILEDPQAPGEHLVMESVGQKLAPLWLSHEEAEAFARQSPAARGMQVGRLEEPVLKEAFLVALGLLGVRQLVVGYRPGQPQAVLLERVGVLGEIRQRMRARLEDS